MFEGRWCDEWRHRGRPAGPEGEREAGTTAEAGTGGWPLPLRELKALLYEVYLAAGAPSLDEMTEDIAAGDDLEGAPSRDTVHRVISDGERPGQQADVVAVAWVLARRAAWDTASLAARVRELWVQARMAQGAGRPIGDLRGDVRLVLDGGLGVHPALDSDGARDRFGILPTYIRRDHDAHLRTVVDAAVAGRSGMAVLVGGSSTGKTRALWEAVAALPDGWRLWHPLTPAATDAALAALPDIAPKTVVWLNEAQHYLGPDPRGEQVTAGLRELLTEPSRAPVLILGTLWPEHWDTLTTRADPDRHPGARALLGGHKIDVPKAFTPADLAALNATDTADPRLIQAAEHAADAQVTQYLAGVPYLMDRYHAADGATRALIHAAMDARRLGASLHIPLDWLADAAPGYLTDTEYHALAPDWLSQALAYVTTPCNGIPGILTPLNISRPRNQRTLRQPDHSPRGSHYLLTDYLDQHGRHHRATTIPPIDFWTAAAHHAHPADLTALGEAAWNRGLYRDAAQLHKHAITHNAHTAAHLVSHLHTLFPADRRPAQWVVAHVALDNPGAIADLLRELQEAGAQEQVIVLAERAAAHAALDNPGAVAELLRELRRAGAQDQVTVLAERAAAHAALDNPFGVAVLLEKLREAGAQEQVTVLLSRDPAVHATLDNADAVVRLLRELRRARAQEQVTVLAERVAAHFTLNNPEAVGMLLRELRRAGSQDQVTVLAERAAAHAALNHPDGVGVLLRELRKIGRDEAVTVLLTRDPAAHAAFANPYAVGMLLRELSKAGAQEQVTVLAEQAAAHAALDNSYAVGMLLSELRRAGAQEQVTVLAERAAAHAALKHPDAANRLLRELCRAGADEETTTLLTHDPAAHAVFDNPYAVDMLLRELRRAGAQEQVTVLAEQAAAHAALDSPYAIAALLVALGDAGADEQVAVLAERLPAAGHFALFAQVGGSQEQFRLGREPDGSAAPSWTWNDMD
ncbi:hypothetical protein ACFWFI_32090 [Streptomyces sp. NPDC060209]|uniref:hypothetical protein n=1 Tax=Streptomyces sp. NPDC060209 TaxID=3347073 RepID=UPI003649C4F0